MCFKFDQEIFLLYVRTFVSDRKANIFSMLWTNNCKISESKMLRN